MLAKASPGQPYLPTILSQPPPGRFQSPSRECFVATPGALPSLTWPPPTPCHFQGSACSFHLLCCRRS